MTLSPQKLFKQSQNEIVQETGFELYEWLYVYVSGLLSCTRMDIFKNIIVLRSLRSIYSRSTLNKQILSVSLKTEKQIIT